MWSYLRIPSARIASLSLFVLISVPQLPTLAQAEESSEPKEGEIPTSFIPFASLGCQSGVNKFKAELQGGAVEELFTVTLGECTANAQLGGRFRRGSGISIRQSVELKLNPEASIERCNSFSMAVLLQIESSTESISWNGIFYVPGNVALRNNSGARADTSFFRLHEKTGVADLNVRADFIGEDSDFPTFSEYYWGEIEISGVELENSLADILSKKLPIIGTEEHRPDAVMEFGLIVRDIQGWCTQSIKSPGGDGIVAKRNILEFSISK